MSITANLSKLRLRPVGSFAYPNGSFGSRPASRPGLCSLHQQSSIFETGVTSIDAPNLAPSLSSQESKFLQNLVKSSPLFLEAPKKNVEEFQFPLGTTFRAPSRRMGLGMKNNFTNALREYGIVAIELGFEDPQSQFLLEIVEAMGGTPDTHSSTQGALVTLYLTPDFLAWN